MAGPVEVKTEEIIREYAAYLGGSGKAFNSLVSYERDIRQFADWLEEEGRAGPMGAGPDDIEAYLAYLKERKLSAATISRHTTSLRKFFGWARERNIILIDPMTSILSPKVIRRAPSVLSGDEIARLVKACDAASPRGLRDRAMLMLLARAGLSISELLGTGTEDVDLKERRIRISVGRADAEAVGTAVASAAAGKAEAGDDVYNAGGGADIGIRSGIGSIGGAGSGSASGSCSASGSGGGSTGSSTCADRYVSLDRGTVSALRRYLSDGRPALLDKKADCGSLFLGSTGGRMSRQGFCKGLKLIARGAGIDKNVTPAVLRHSYAVNAIKAGRDPKAVQESMGLATGSMMEDYSRMAAGG